MKVLFVSSEAYPFSKTGGLADVAGSLPKALGRLDHDIYLFTPLYAGTRKAVPKLNRTSSTIAVDIDGKEKTGTLWETKITKNVRAMLLESSEYFDREGLYGNEDGDWPDNLARFAFFSKAALELCRIMGLKPDIIHCNDWQSALVPTYLKTIYKSDPAFKRTSTVYTIHNMSYQGHFPADQWGITGLGNEYFTPKYLEYYDKINLMKGGIIFSDSLTTVSSTYSQEIQNTHLGCGLEGLLSEYSYKLSGIINGVDYDEWDPAKDPFIIANYKKSDISGKARCKAALQKRFNLPQKERTPVIGMISRIIAQKGFDILANAMKDLLTRPVQVVLLGTGQKEYVDRLAALSKEHPDKFACEIAYDNKLAHRIEAGADMFLMPSRFEPCGLNQMYSLKYGTIPLVSSVGGLEDTIKAFDQKTKRGNGFKINSDSVKDLLSTVDAALSIYKQKPLWKKLQQNAMGADFSWKRSAKQYEKLYEVIGKKSAGPRKKQVIEIRPQKDLEA